MKHPVDRADVQAGDPPQDFDHIRDWFELAVTSERQAMARAVVANLVRAVPANRMRKLDVQMRERSPYLGGVPMPRVAERFDAVAGSGPDRWPLLGLLSMVRDGHIRERAVRALVEGPDLQVAPFLLLRADDWVTEVRAPAEQAILGLMDPERGPILIQNLPVLWDRFMSMVSWGRARELIAAIRSWLEAPTQRPLLWSGVASPDRWVIRMCVSMLIRDDVVALYRAVGGSDDVLAVCWAGLACLKHDSAAIEVIDDLLDSRFGALREAAAFWSLHHRGGDEQLVERLMFDRLRSVRFQAQHHLRAGGRDPADWYRERLPDERAFRGLSDVATDADLQTGLNELRSVEPRRRLAAVALLGRLGHAQAHSALVEGVADPSPAVSKRAARGIGRQGVSLHDVERLVDIAASTDAPHAARNVRRALVDTTRWNGLVGALQLLELSGEPEREGKLLLETILLTWERSFLDPTTEQLRLINRALDRLRTQQPELVGTVEGVIARYRAPD